MFQSRATDLKPGSPWRSTTLAPPQVLPRITGVKERRTNRNIVWSSLLSHHFMLYSAQKVPVKDTLAMTLVFIDTLGFKSQRPASQSVSEPEVSSRWPECYWGGERWRKRSSPAVLTTRANARWGAGQSATATRVVALLEQTGELATAGSRAHWPRAGAPGGDETTTWLGVHSYSHVYT